MLVEFCLLEKYIHKTMNTYGQDAICLDVIKDQNYSY